MCLGRCTLCCIWRVYLLVALALLKNDEFLRLVINSIRNDITGRNEPFQCLALNFIGSGEHTMYMKAIALPPEARAKHGLHILCPSV
jgi:hypothetical protein